MPAQQGNVSHKNLNVINAILFVAENGCKWRALPKLTVPKERIMSRLIDLGPLVGETKGIYCGGRIDGTGCDLSPDLTFRDELSTVY